MTTQPKSVQEREDIASLSAGVDWLTVTVISREAREALYVLCRDLRDHLEDLGDKLRPWKFCGYQGFQLGGTRYGTRGDSDIAMLSGVDAQECWQAAGAIAENCSRVDLAVSVELQHPYLNVAKDCYDWVQWNRDLVSARRLTYTYIENSLGGQTLYVGSRASDQYGRLYDKYCELGVPDRVGLLWRYEVEFKKPRAKKILMQLLQRHEQPAVTEVISGTVRAWFLGREIPPIWPHNNNILTTEVEARVTSAEIKLHWLATQVGPSVRWLVEQGKGGDVIEALGLNDNVVFTPTEKAFAD